MDRLENLRCKIDELISDLQEENKRYFTVHLYGVSHFAALLAIRRGLDSELASVAGMLHDIHPAVTGNYTDHAVKGAERARKILQTTEEFSEDEIKIITDAISRHSNKEMIQQLYDEILKDADVLHHCLYNPSKPIKTDEKERFNNLQMELGITRGDKQC